MQAVQHDDGLFCLQVNEPHETIPALLAEVQKQGCATGAPDHATGQPGRCLRAAHRPASAGGVMATTEQPPVASEPRARRDRRNGRWAGYLAPAAARMKELWREPEVIFWVFVFPLLLALGLGIAFRDKPADSPRLRSLPGRRRRKLSTCCSARREDASIRADVLGAAAALDGFGWANTRWLSAWTTPGVHYRYDPARPESVLARTPGGRCTADRGGTQESHQHGQHRRRASRARATSTS